MGVLRSLTSLSRPSLPLRRDVQALARAIDDPHRPASEDPALELVQELRATGDELAAQVVPRDRFRADLRTRLMAVAAVQGQQEEVPAAAAPGRAAQPGVQRRPTWRAGVVAAGALASVVAATGVAVAGSQSLPGDPLYGVKRTTEALQLRLTDGDVDRGTLHLELAATRLREVRDLTVGDDDLAGPPVDGVRLDGSAAGGSAAGGSAAGGSPAVLAAASRPLPDGAALGAPVADRVRDTLADMDDDTLEGQALLEAAFRSSGDDAPLRVLERFATRQSAGLEQLMGSLPAASVERARTSLALVDDVGADARALLASDACGPTCDPGTSAPTTPLAGSPGADPLEPSASPGAACGCTPAPGSAGTPAPAPPTDPRSAPAPGSSPGAAPAGPGVPAPQPPQQPAASPAPPGGPLPPASPAPLPSLPPLPGPLPSPSPLAPLPLPTPLPLPLPLPTPLPGVPLG